MRVSGVVRDLIKGSNLLSYPRVSPPHRWMTKGRGAYATIVMKNGAYPLDAKYLGFTHYKGWMMVRVIMGMRKTRTSVLLFRGYMSHW